MPHPLRHTHNRRLLQHPLFQALLAGVLALVLYLNVMHGGFIFDDWIYLVENPLIRDFRYFLHLGNLREYADLRGIALSHIDLIYNFVLRPVSYLTFAVNYHLHGMETTGYHVVNIFFHVAATMLAYLFTHLLVERLRHTTGEGEGPSYIPLMVAVFFAIHPVQAQAVSYIVQRFAAIAACCYLLALAAYIKCRTSPSTKGTAFWYAVALAVTVTGMLAKENVFTLPIMIMAVELLCFRESPRKRVCLLVPFLATMAIIPLTIMGLTGRTQDLVANVQLINFQQTPHLSYIFTEFRVLMTYLRLLVLPTGQQLDYDYPLYGSLLAPPVIASLFCLLALAAVAAWALYRGRTAGRSRFLLAGFGILWFFVTLAVESGLVPTDDVIFEHRLYLPAVGFFIAAAATAEHLYRAMDAKPWPRLLARMALAAVAVALSIATLKRNLLWSDTLQFWLDNAAKSPRKPRVLKCLGETYMRSGRSEEALTIFEKIPITRSTPYNLIQNMANVYILRGDFDKGVQTLRRAMELNPEDHLPYRDLGIKYQAFGDYDMALKFFDAAIARNKQDLVSRRSRAAIFRQKAMIPQAIAEYEAILAGNPDDLYTLQELWKLRTPWTPNHE